MVGGSSGHSKPRRSWAAWHEPERDGAEQRCFREVRRQLDADAGDVFDHARPDLNQALPDGRELATGKRAGLWNRGAHAVISQNAAVWSTSRT